DDGRAGPSVARAGFPARGARGVRGAFFAAFFGALFAAFAALFFADAPVRPLVLVFLSLTKWVCAPSLQRTVPSREVQPEHRRRRGRERPGPPLPLGPRRLRAAPGSPGTRSRLVDATRGATRPRRRRRRRSAPPCACGTPRP